MNTVELAKLTPGGLHTDSRGALAFFNQFSFCGVDRFYIIRPDPAAGLRGWIGHRRDRKWFVAAAGTVVLGLVQPDSWSDPSPDLRVEQYILSAENPQVLCVPGGYASALHALSSDAVVIVFSSGRIESAKEDEFRFPATTWRLDLER